MFDGRMVGRQLRELIRALFDFPDPRAAVAGDVEVVVTPKPETEEQKDG